MSESLIPDPFTTEKSSDCFGGTAYNRERASPNRRDGHYLHFSDLHLALERIAERGRIRLLDFGCGSSPYSHLFPDAEFQRADFGRCDDLDYVIKEGKPLGAPDEAFDLVLSTMVLEHVADYQFYLRECWRLVRPGGRLVIAAPGVFPDHAVPYDFRRWTTVGIRKDLGDAGFEVLRVWKVTTGLRALAYLCLIWGREIVKHQWSLFGFLPSALLRIFSKFGKTFHRWADKAWKDQRVVADSADSERLYLAFLVEAIKPDP